MWDVINSHYQIVKNLMCKWGDWRKKHPSKLAACRQLTPNTICRHSCVEVKHNSVLSCRPLIGDRFWCGTEVCKQLLGNWKARGNHCWWLVQVEGAWQKKSTDSRRATLTLDATHCGFSSFTISLKAIDFRMPPISRMPPPIQATNSAEPNVYLQRQRRHP